MKKLEFSKTVFLRSAVNPEDYPVLHKGKDKVPEVALVGRSNVGKSSLINHLTQLKSLAKTSSVPGKTQTTINFYLTDNNLCLVDLPGYGFSKVSHTIKHTWSDSLQQYLQNREELKLILVLIDFRRTLSIEDKDFIEWASSQKKNCFSYSLKLINFPG
jgi:GTP-binding protein